MKSLLIQLLRFAVVYLVGYICALALGIPLKTIFGIFFLMFLGYLLVDWLANEQEKEDAQSIEKVEVFEIVEDD